MTVNTHYRNLSGAAPGQVGGCADWASYVEVVTDETTTIASK